MDSGSISKGNQIKIHRGGLWYKLDSDRCSQGLAEEFASLFIQCVEDVKGVRYWAGTAEHEGYEVNCCISNDAWGTDTEFISLRKLFKNNGVPANIRIATSHIESNISNVIDTVLRLTGLDIREYLLNMLLIDALIINEDRHLQNIGVLRKDGRYLEAPIFDNGSSLFCVNWTYRPKKSFTENIESASRSCRPFSKFFDKQVRACINLGAKPLRINGKFVEGLSKGYSCEFYPIEKVELIKSVLRNRLDYYKNTGVYVLV